MKVSENMLWSLPFLHAAQGLVPLDKLKKVSGYTIRATSHEPTYAVCQQDGKKFVIRVRLTGWTDGGGRPTKQPLFIAQLLDSLAHELAHMVHWEHTPQHLALQSDLLKRFAHVADREGVKDTYLRLGRTQK